MFSSTRIVSMPRQMIHMLMLQKNRKQAKWVKVMPSTGRGVPLATDGTNTPRIL
jgi:hypothetical protein